jgi:hypothetical protein
MRLDAGAVRHALDDAPDDAVVAVDLLQLRLRRDQVRIRGLVGVGEQADPVR